MLGCTPPALSAQLHWEAQKGLLTCLGGLAAIATSQVHARRSYLLVVLLMKRWGISLNPGVTSSDTDALFQQSKSFGGQHCHVGCCHLIIVLTFGIPSSVPTGPDASTRGTADIWKSSEGFAAISQEIFALCDDKIFHVNHQSMPPQSTSATSTQAVNSLPSHQTGVMASQASANQAFWSAPLPSASNPSNSYVGPAAVQTDALPLRTEGAWADDQMKLFDFGLGSLDGLLSSPTNGIGLIDWERPSLGDIFDLSLFNQNTVSGGNA